MFTSFCWVLALMTVPSLRLMMVKGGWSSVHALTFTWSKSKSLKANLVGKLRSTSFFYLRRGGNSGFKSAP